jgi:predicted MFS family arabinose efflux permease
MKAITVQPLEPDTARLEDVPEPDHDTLLRRQQAFGYTLEDQKYILGPMARNGMWAIGSMGNDAPLAVLSDRLQILYNYFKQLFAQVTNPPLDCIREEMVTSVLTHLGPEGNLLEPGPEAAHQISLVTTFTQIGYALGMPAFIPLGDFVERRRLVVLMFLAVTIALVGAALAPSLAWLCLASLAVGVTTVIAQLLIPLATELSSPEEQGRVIGRILSGILLGILLARTLSGTVAEYWGWRAMFWLAAGIALVLTLLLRQRLPHLPVHSQISYPQLMLSIWQLVKELPKLRQVSLVAGMLFAAFTAFWTTLVFLLETPPYHYGSQAAGLFGIVGATGVLIAPVAGKLCDQYTPRFVAGIAIVICLAGFVVFWGLGLHLWGLVLGVILLDMGVQAAQVANQSRVLALLPESRNRVNTVYMICYFTGGSLGSLVGGWSWGHWQWTGVCAIGLMFIVIAGAGWLMRGPEAV